MVFQQRLCLVASFCTTPMSFAQLLRKFSQPNLAGSVAHDAGVDASDDSNKLRQQRQASEPMPTMHRFWRRTKKSSTTDRSNPSESTSIHPLPPKTESSTSEDGVIAVPLPIPLPTTPVFANNLDRVSPPEMIPTVSPVPDKLAEAWDAIKDGPNIANASRRLDTVGVGVSFAIWLLFYSKLFLTPR